MISMYEELFDVLLHNPSLSAETIAKLTRRTAGAAEKLQKLKTAENPAKEGVT